MFLFTFAKRHRMQEM